jgi:hypothetical protein
MKKYNVSYEDAWESCPPEYYFMPNEWLCFKTKSIAVWTDFIIGKCNEKQKSVLENLKKEKIYMGEI